ncbi:hypothetical protein ABZZ79_10330 [Streptomyces sp. NPDC006458]|uniref:hypothetical protein n=1 Tax=Streptomyces sp. NPDC006458 TaxID=3154302 RepID=UPI0033A44127
MATGAYRERPAEHMAVAARLSLLGDRHLADAVAAAEPLGSARVWSGIGGRSARLEVAGARVFVKGPHTPKGRTLVGGAALRECPTPFGAWPTPARGTAATADARVYEWVEGTWRGARRS